MNTLKTVVSRAHVAMGVAAGLLLTAASAIAQPQVQPQPQQQPEEGITLSPLVSRLIEDPVTSDAERRSLRVFHGQWDALDEPTAPERARMALIRFDLLDAALEDDVVAPLLRAKAAYHRGEPEQTLELLKNESSIAAALWRARAHDMLGRADKAVDQLLPLREKLGEMRVSDAGELTAAAEAVVLLATLQGRPSQDYHLAVSLLARAHNEIDPLYWPAYLAEAKLLIDKDNRAEGAQTLLETLALNPRCAEAWYMLGRLHVDGYAFDKVAGVLKQLRKIDEHTLLADLLELRSLLRQRDAQSAATIALDCSLSYPKNRQLLALTGGIHALRYDETALEAELANFDQVSPNSPLAYFEVGQVLAAARQYDWSERLLREAIRRQPNWPDPRIELGLMLMQAGNDEVAHAELSKAARLDPFNLRAANQLQLVEELLGYERIETEHFVIKYKKDTVDQVLARDMPRELEKIYDDVTAAFQHKPQRKTHIDIMPNEEWFGVRITGMPDIWTIAACTGDVISLTPPRVGPKQSGTYFWSNVMRHEYVHTVTLAQTNNRVPHWFTEACAVSMELTGRDYTTCRLLADALATDTLFDLDNINWGFIRPKTPRDRPLAYAQSHWMLEYITETAGRQAVVDMLNLFREGRSDIDAFEQVLSQSPEAFMSGFRSWAGGQVERWGLGQHKTSERLREVLEGEAGELTREEIDKLLDEHPNHPALLEWIARDAMENASPEVARQAVLRYADVRPVDDWAHKALVELALKTDSLEQAIPSLKALEAGDNKSGRWALLLARVHREAGRLNDAAEFARRALLREPYNAQYRELAATIALQQGDMEEALKNVEDLTILEPDRVRHHVRLAALLFKLERPDEADAAARKALELDDDAPVKPFLK